MKTLSNLADRQEVEDRIATLSPADAARWGVMSVHQMMCHLNDAYRLALGEKSASSASGILQRRLIKGLALKVPIQWGKGFPTPPEMEQGKGGTAPGEFVQDRAWLLASVARFCDQLPEPYALHPFFGKMSAKDWWRWGYLHADHHLRQFGR